MSRDNGAGVEAARNSLFSDFVYSDTQGARETDQCRYAIITSLRCFLVRAQTRSHFLTFTQAHCIHTSTLTHAHEPKERRGKEKEKEKCSHTHTQWHLQDYFFI